MTNPVVEPAETGKLAGSIVPIYSLCKGIGVKTLQNMLLSAIDSYISLFPEILPEEVVSHFGLMRASDVIRNIHFPQDYETLKKARERIIFEEFFLFQQL